MDKYRNLNVQVAGNIQITSPLFTDKSTNWCQKCNIYNCKYPEAHASAYIYTQNHQYDFNCGHAYNVHNTNEYNNIIYMDDCPYCVNGEVYDYGELRKKCTTAGCNNGEITNYKCPTCR